MFKSGSCTEFSADRSIIWIIHIIEIFFRGRYFPKNVALYRQFPFRNDKRNEKALTAGEIACAPLRQMSYAANNSSALSEETP